MRSPPQAAPHRLALDGLRVAAAAVPLAWYQGVATEYTLPKLLVLGLAVLLSAIGSALSLGSTPPRPCRTPLDRPLLGWAFALGLSALFSQDRMLSLMGRYNAYELGLIALTLYAGLYYAAAWILDDRSRPALLRLAVWAGVVISCYGILQTLGIEPFHLSDDIPYGRAVSTLGSPVDLGAYLTLLLPLALHQCLNAPGSRLWSSIAFAAVAGGLLSTSSRGAWLAGAAGIGLYLLLSGRARLLSRSPALKAAAFAALVAAGLFARHQLASRPSAASDLARREAWRVSLQTFRDHPWSGSGPDTFGHEFRRRKTPAFTAVLGPTTHHANAHNDLLQTLATLGVPGGVAYLWLLTALVLAARGRLREESRSDESAALCGSLASLFIGLKFNPLALEVLGTGALLCGALLSRSSPPKGKEPAASDAGSGAAAAALCASSLAAFLSVAWLMAADRQAQLGRLALGSGRAEAALQSLRRAVRMNPCENKYLILFANTAADKVRAAPRAPESSSLLEEASRAAEAVSVCHPSDPQGYYIQGYVSLIRGQLGDKPRILEAGAALDKALERDPLFLPLVELRAEAAAAAGDGATAARMRELARSLGPKAL